ncbi:radical SAM protein [Agromyces intestinalis]|uniref:Radical SAM protein n=1 Tax=Agromyces intestinalis TaxID=2592652 RepID=A0A5C1YFX8_9MICO|nr:Rv2578c family radical SAM protein [Agromyces intestinalis]QEO13682.1 radical SAM protein [Agromyces intestinalis]
MRWSGQELGVEQVDTLPGLARLNNLVRSVQTPEFAGMTFHEVLAKSALNRVPGQSYVPFGWTINPYRGCSHACAYCFARPTHQYLDLDAGEDFDRQIVVKVNAADVLRTELARPSWKHEPVALGTNTDPYQRAEGRYRLMPGIIDALASSGTPFSILTKGTLLRRDLSLLADASQQVPIDLAMSIAVYDDDLQQSVEPGTPSTNARLQTVTAARDAGFDCTVFLMPILPYLTDTRAHLDDALRRAKAAGATGVMHSALHLRGAVKPWFMQWLEREHPELVPKYRAMYPGAAAYAPKAYRDWLAERIRPLIRAHGLVRVREDPATGGVRSTATALRSPPPRTAAQAAARVAEASAAAAVGPAAHDAAPTLF